MIRKVYSNAILMFVYALEMNFSLVLINFFLASLIIQTDNLYTIDQGLQMIFWHLALQLN
ncbi:hypothetical protein BpHYR1_009314 [Brachionus plicatilis]|uniref:Uncharacterized protein n=1 Tax=Brachionus plicatilis TaxID=10195 RepID=A0A3M7QJA1_BRAPC|nr:hypothetical protein BpHYR1_009314 [Brachionus plicatilis]